MTFRFDYLKMLEMQCEAVYPKTDLKRSQSVFCDICKNLSRDFLPPIERDDIAAISYSLVDVASKAKDSSYPEEIKKQMNSLKPILNALFSKNKTCGDDIRRLIDININFESSNQKLMILNDALGDFFKTVLSAYFRNL